MIMRSVITLYCNLNMCKSAKCRMLCYYKKTLNIILVIISEGCKILYKSLGMFHVNLTARGEHLLMMGMRFLGGDNKALFSFTVKYPL